MRRYSGSSELKPEQLRDLTIVYACINAFPSLEKLYDKLPQIKENIQYILLNGDFNQGRIDAIWKDPQFQGILRSIRRQPEILTYIFNLEENLLQDCSELGLSFMRLFNIFKTYYSFSEEFKFINNKCLNGFFGSICKELEKKESGSSIIIWQVFDLFHEKRNSEKLDFFYFDDLSSHFSLGESLKLENDGILLRELEGIQDNIYGNATLNNILRYE
ncbi:hypothetical protein FACS1894113_2390 [Alphaproteobacteria bacterium]|nr:hypothetical protein FACS1894113_2390 [Alphaproteobacteria bacterium]